MYFRPPVSAAVLLPIRERQSQPVKPIRHSSPEQHLIVAGRAPQTATTIRFDDPS
jgi:hypothetical protein